MTTYQPNKSPKKLKIVLIDWRAMIDKMWTGQKISEKSHQCCFCMSSASKLCLYMIFPNYTFKKVAGFRWWIHQWCRISRKKFLNDLIMSGSSEASQVKRVAKWRKKLGTCFRSLVGEHRISIVWRMDVRVWMCRSTTSNVGAGTLPEDQWTSSCKQEVETARLWAVCFITKSIPKDAMGEAEYSHWHQH